MRRPLIVLAVLCLLPARASEPGQPLDCSDWVFLEPGLTCSTWATPDTAPIPALNRGSGLVVDNLGRMLFVRVTNDPEGGHRPDSVGGDSEIVARVHLFLGQKSLDEDDWPGSDQHDEVGVLVTVGLRRWPVQVAIDLLVSAGDADAVPGLVVLDQYTIELDLGVRKTWERGRAMVFVGGGPAFIGGGGEFLAVPGIVADNDDTGVGFWVNGGVFWRLGESFNLGFEGRISRAEVDVGSDVEAGGEHLGLVLGWSW